MVSVVPCNIQHSLPTSESAPCVVIASSISPLAPLPLSGFMSAVGTAPAKSGLIPHISKHHASPFSSSSIAPHALNIPTATSMAMRYGIIPTAVLNPSLAPSINASYTFIFLIMACSTNHVMMLNKMIAAAAAETIESVSAVSSDAPQMSSPTNPVRPIRVPRTIGSTIFIF